MPSHVTVAVAILDKVRQPELFICNQLILQGMYYETQLTLGLLTAYKMHTGLVFLSGIE